MFFGFCTHVFPVSLENVQKHEKTCEQQQKVKKISWKLLRGDVINANGVLVHPDEIEQKILKHWPGLNCSVLGVQDPKKIKDTIIILAIEGKHDLSLHKILQQLINTDKAMVPQQILTFDELPKTRSGKINRKALGIRVSVGWGGGKFHDCGFQGSVY